MIFSDEEKQYYSRQNLLSEVSIEKQWQLKQSSVLVVGAGGLGATVLQILARAGVGKIGVVDFDTIDITNIHRQILYTYADVGKYKVDVAVENLKHINPFIHIEPYQLKISNTNVVELISNYDIVVDATDNFDAIYLINDACVLNNKILVFAAVQQHVGQVAVFNFNGSCNYRDVFPEIPMQLNNCNSIGVLNTAVNIIGTLQANEAFKVILELDNILCNKLLIYDVLNNTQQLLNIKKQYNFQFKNLKHHNKDISEIDVDDLAQLNPLEYYLIDVRSAYEHQQENIGGLNFPLGILEDKLQELDKNKQIIFYCNTNVRSKTAAKVARKIGFENVIILSR